MLSDSLLRLADNIFFDVSEDRQQSPSPCSVQKDRKKTNFAIAK